MFELVLEPQILHPALKLASLDCCAPSMWPRNSAKVDSWQVNGMPLRGVHEFSCPRNISGILVPEVDLDVATV